MGLGVAQAQGALTGERYIESLKDSREVWLAGERVDVTTHPAFAGMLREMARLYDLQHEPAFRDDMTFVSAETGNRLSYSYFLPRSEADLLKKRRNAEIWMEESWGQMARAPDFMSNVVVGLYDFRNELSRLDPRFGENAFGYYRYAAEHDLAITHAIGDPQIDRSARPTQNPDLALRAVRETEDGIIVRGAKQLATLAPVSNEILVYLSASFALREERSFVQWFAVPIATPGLKVVCREPLALHGTGYSHPLASRYDEQDAMVIFDDVLVPWERVFLLYDGPLALQGLGRINAWSGYSSIIRFYYRMQAFIGVSSMVAEAIGVDGFREVRDKIGELMSYAEMVRLALRGMETECFVTTGGLMSPSMSAGPGIFAAQITPRMVEILREIGASGLIMQPSEADLANSELRPYLDRYMHGKNMDVAEKSRLFRLAWDLVGDGSGSRQDLYERWHRGDIVRNRNNLFLRYDRGRILERIRRLISEPMPE
jgi:4-hydroxyphenylacetate 3-monooxygenase